MHGTYTPFIVEVLKAYSHTPDQLYDLRKAREVVRGDASNEPDDPQPPQPRPWSMADRLSPEDVQAMIEKYHAGTIAQDLAAQYGISVKSVRRLLRKHGARLCDRKDEAG
jgi:DNA-directed RNA polymerase specialized sigma24 family protein